MNEGTRRSMTPLLLPLKSPALQKKTWNAQKGNVFTSPAELPRRSKQLGFVPLFGAVATVTGEGGSFGILTVDRGKFGMKGVGAFSGRGGRERKV